MFIQRRHNDVLFRVGKEAANLCHQDKLRPLFGLSRLYRGVVRWIRRVFGKAGTSLPY